MRFMASPTTWPCTGIQCGGRDQMVVWTLFRSMWSCVAYGLTLLCVLLVCWLTVDEAEACCAMQAAA